jgi:hypothetical protein
MRTYFWRLCQDCLSHTKNLMPIRDLAVDESEHWNLACPRRRTSWKLESNRNIPELGVEFYIPHFFLWILKELPYNLLASVTWSEGLTPFQHS